MEGIINGITILHHNVEDSAVYVEGMSMVIIPILVVTVQNVDGRTKHEYGTIITLTKAMIVPVGYAQDNNA